jgi:hypothetical protein
MIGDFHHFSPNQFYMPRCLNLSFGVSCIFMVSYVRLAKFQISSHFGYTLRSKISWMFDLEAT